MSKAVLGIGSNVGDRLKNLTDAVASLKLLPDTGLLSCSHVYLTEPQGYADQDDFFNICLALETSLSPHALLGACLGIEAALGRIRSFKNGPRIIDLDLLLYESFVSSTKELTLPHPRLTERGFVLCPLAELYPDCVCFGLDFGSALSACSDQRVVRTDYYYKDTEFVVEVEA